LSDPEDLITIYKAANSAEAYFIKNLLMDAGIEATVAEEYDPLALPAVSPTEVLIRQQDEARAKPIIDSFEEEQIRRAERPDWSCPKCGATVIGAFDECDVCGAPRPGSELEE
jgi:rubrerythrin